MTFILIAIIVILVALLGYIFIKWKSAEYKYNELRAATQDEFDDLELRDNSGIMDDFLVDMDMETITLDDIDFDEKPQTKETCP